MGYKGGSWQRTGARLTIDRHHLVFHQIGQSKTTRGLPTSFRTQTSETIRWPSHLAITAVVAEASFEQHGNRWNWSIVRGGRVIEKGSTLKETGARASVRRRLVDLVEATRKTAAIQQLEADLIKRMNAQEYSVGPLPPEDTARVRVLAVDVEGDDATVSAVLGAAAGAIGGGS